MLRFLQDGTFRPLGGRQLRQANVRIIAASNVDLAELVRAGTFRLDLLYRLRLMAVEMPPLRERTGDIRLLAEAFLQRLILQYGEEKCLDPESLEALERYHWPGNVRELEHVLHREFLLTEGSVLRIRQDSIDLLGPRTRRSQYASPDAGTTLDFNTAKARAISEFERAYIIRMLQAHGGNVSAAARSCGKERRAFGRLMKKYGIDKERYR
jgi:two-component system response regulator GlrR